MRLLVAALAALSTCTTAKGLESPAPKRHRIDEVLPSGLRLIIEEARGTDSAMVVTVISAGMDLDPAGKWGLAHLVEHLTAGRDFTDGAFDVERLKRSGSKTSARTPSSAQSSCTPSGRARRFGRWSLATASAS